MIGEQVGSPPTLEWIAASNLQVDPAYQRATDGALSRRIIAGMVKRWDWSLCQPLVVSRRPDGSMWILDGQHRHAGATERGDIPHLPCVVLTGRTHEGEAETFVALNTQRQKLSQADVFNGMLASGDPDAKEMAETLAATGWRQVRSSGTDRYKPGDLACAPLLVKFARSHGLPIIRNALTALREAYSDKPVRNAATLLKALIAIYRDGDMDGKDPDLFIDMLGSIEPTDWEDYGREHRKLNPALSRVAGISGAMMAAYSDFAADNT